MAQGLGKNSPVVLSLGRESYEALIERHGQYVRWRQAKKCPCVTGNNQPDIHCKKCGGSGSLYDYQKDYTGYLRLRVMHGIVELPEEYENCMIENVYNYAGVEFEFVKSGRYIQLIDPEQSITQGEILDISFTDNLISFLEEAKLERVCKGYYRVPNLNVPHSKIEGVLYKPFCDLVDIEELKASNGENIKIKDYRKDGVRVESDEDYPFLTARNIRYMKPPKFVILSQNLNKETMELLHKHSGDAVCSFPYYYDVAEGDIITVLSGTITNKIVLKKQNESDEDIIPEFFVEKIVSIETTKERFIEGKDFILAEANRIFWIGNKKINKGEYFSITFKYNPTYRVVKNIPSLRTSEDQRIPRKVVLQLFSSFQEKGRVHING